MEQAAFIRTIHDELENDVPRLVFADWLEEHGQSDRANWIRKSHRPGEINYHGPIRVNSGVHEIDLFRRCRPTWWQDITGVSRLYERGMVRLKIGSKAAAGRIGKNLWLADAWAEGWLDGFEIPWCDGSLARTSTRWPDAIRQIPLFVSPAPQITDEGLAIYYGVPRLWGLQLYRTLARKPSISELALRNDLRELQLDGFPEEDADTLVEQVGRLSGLRRLIIRGHLRPTDADMKLLVGLTELRYLSLSGCDSLTDAALKPLRRLTGLQVLKLRACRGLTSAGVEELLRVLPTLQVDGGELITGTW